MVGKGKVGDVGNVGKGNVGDVGNVVGKGKVGEGLAGLPHVCSAALPLSYLSSPNLAVQHN